MKKRICSWQYPLNRSLSLSTPPPSHSLGGLLLLIISLLKPEWIPRSGPDERSASELRRHWAINRSKLMLSDDPTACRFDTVAHKDAQALAGWQSLIVFSTDSLTLPFQSRTVGRLHNAFLYSGCFVQHGQVDAPQSPFSSDRDPEIQLMKEPDWSGLCVLPFEVSAVIIHGLWWLLQNVALVFYFLPFCVCYSCSCSSFLCFGCIVFSWTE